jgi:hypothetical protein
MINYTSIVPIVNCDWLDPGHCIISMVVKPNPDALQHADMSHSEFHHIHIQE